MNDPTIEDECVLYRRIHNEQVVPDDGGFKISSAAFGDAELSIHLGDELEFGGHELEAVLDNQYFRNLAGITAALAREKDQSVFRDPQDDSLCHGIVHGKKPKSVARAFAQAAKENWVIRSEEYRNEGN